MSDIIRRIQPASKDIGFIVRRLLPVMGTRSIGPFVFLDHMGPAHFAAEGTAGDVRQHPHIGLATVTYLRQGAMMHRDSLGTVQRITPGDINLMVAGSGITHSERVPADIRQQGIAVEGLQMWLALPLADEACAPSFHHYPAASLPAWQLPGADLQLLIGHHAGRQSPVRTFSDTLYLSWQLSSRCPLSNSRKRRSGACTCLTAAFEWAMKTYRPASWWCWGMACRRSSASKAPVAWYLAVPCWTHPVSWSGTSSPANANACNRRAKTGLPGVLRWCQARRISFHSLE